MDAINIEISNNKTIFHNDSFNQARKVKAKIIQWVLTNENINVEVIMPDNIPVQGLSEISVKNLEIGDIVQFERFGFVRLNKKEKDNLTFYFAHK
jgi:glutamyl-tRNA synthetase